MKGAKIKMNFGERLKRIRLKRGLTLMEVGKVLGKTEATVQRYESGNIKNPKSDTILELAAALNVRPAFLMGWEVDEIDVEISTDYDYLPVSVAAGIPEILEGLTDGEIKKMSIPDALMGRHAGSKDIFLIKTNGDSMNKLFPSGALIAIKKCCLEQLKDGDIVVYSEDHNYSVKKFYDLGENLVFKPESYDERFTDYVIPKNKLDLNIHGKVVMYIVDLD